MRRAVSLWYVGIAVAVMALAFSAPALAGEAKGTIKIATQSPLSGDQAAHRRRHQARRPARDRDS